MDESNGMNSRELAIQWSRAEGERLRRCLWYFITGIPEWVCVTWEDEDHDPWRLDYRFESVHTNMAIHGYSDYDGSLVAICYYVSDYYTSTHRECDGRLERYYHHMLRYAIRYSSDPLV